MPKNTVIVFISDNSNFITQLFDNFIQKLNISNAQNKSTLYADIIYKIPICEKLPQILDRWSHRECLLSATVEKLSTELGTDEGLESDVISCVNRTVLVNYGEKCIAYLHIKPLLILDLSPCSKDITAVYTDLCTRYATLKLGTNNQKRFQPILFTSSPMAGLDSEEWLNLFRNYLFITGEVSGQCAPYGLNCVKCPEANECPGIDINTNGITATKSSICLPSIIDQLSIEQLKYEI